jgi:glucose/mannose-6-phosphate isomerase
MRVSRLDNLEFMAGGDPVGMGDWVTTLPEQCESAFKIGNDAPLVQGRRFQQVVILGIGGSAIGGDLLRGYSEAEIKIPFTVNRNYDIPAFVGPETLVIASSYSGNTEETLNAYEQAKARGAQMMAISTGGELEARAQRDGVPFAKIPGGLSPRAALGYSFIPLMVILSRLGLISDKGAEFRDMVDLLKAERGRLGREVPAADNPAKQLAERLHGKLPLFYGAYPWSSVVAYRWKGQMNENGKNLAFTNAFPELNHNETVGWEHPDSLTREVEVVLLRDRGDLPKVQRRFEVTSEIMRPHASGISEVWSRGDSTLARMFSLIFFGDFVSYYLALLNGIDPTPVKVIDYPKGQLATV